MLDKSKESLFAIPQVIGVGHGKKEVGGIQTDQDAIIVLVKEKLPPEKLAEEQIVPRSVNGKVTDVIEIGEFKAYMGGTGSILTENYDLLLDNQRISRLRPAVPGISIANYRVTAGTFGAVVYDKSTGQPMILSNNHILANASNGKDGRAMIGDPILQPGRMDGGNTSRNMIAKLTRYVSLDEYPEVNEVDCAIAAPLKNDLINPAIMGIGTIEGVTAPSLGMAVKKSGRTTEVTVGKIRALNVTSNVNYGAGRVLRFENQILTTKISEGGDSGSLVLDENNLAVGLLFAGSDQGALLNPIQAVLDWLSVKIK